MITVIGFITIFLILLFLLISYYFLVKKPKTAKKEQSNIIQLQTDGFDFILYNGKVKELITDYHRYLADLDVVVYSKRLFIGFLEPKYAYIDIPAKAIQSVKYEPNKLTISCFKELSGTKKIVIKTKTTQQLYHLAKKIDFISRRSKKVTAI
ncbi:hypothetical protein [Tepidibacillus fermentans]|uniref:PH (Pleckstrin Homology) domain-containing protein n=1 Tax=Tepidibacillus fermentans TaxID=1281767 RepID=A0A4R3K8Z0_9BACI|nr:hypothetical protein [Tepidibacillus fermentans]TCS79387.1 hypothetical protein EDD72_12112 [Tepidibacillus fermentans]